MFLVGGENVLVVDAQVHIWDASPHNQAIPDGEVYALDLLRRIPAVRELFDTRRSGD